MRLLLLISSLLALAGCGTKTPLIMSPAPLKPSLLGKPAPQTQITPEAPRHDHSNAPQSRQ